MYIMLVGRARIVQLSDLHAKLRSVVWGGASVSAKAHPPGH